MSCEVNEQIEKPPDACKVLLLRWRAKVEPTEVFADVAGGDARKLPAEVFTPSKEATHRPVGEEIPPSGLGRPGRGDDGGEPRAARGQFPPPSDYQFLAHCATLLASGLSGAFMYNNILYWPQLSTNKPARTTADFAPGT